MGYCMRQEESKFFMSSEDAPKALQAIKNLAGQETCSDSGGYHFSWVDKDFHKLNTIKEMLDEWRWIPKFNENNDIIEINFGGEKYGDDNKLFNAIAPFVKSGSYITMIGEDGSWWRWKFDGEKCKEVPGTVEFIEEEGD